MSKSAPLRNIFEEWDEDCLVLTIDVTKSAGTTKNGNNKVAECFWHSITKKDGRVFSYMLTVVEKTP